MPFRRGKKGLWEQKKTMNNYFSTYLSRLLFLGKDMMPQSVDAHPERTKESRPRVGFFLLTISKDGSRK